jgi:hypothetical protein
VMEALEDHIQEVVVLDILDPVCVCTYICYRNGTLDRGLDTKHGCVCYLRTIELTLRSSLL